MSSHYEKLLTVIVRPTSYPHVVDERGSRRMLYGRLDWPGVAIRGLIEEVIGTKEN